MLRLLLDTNFLMLPGQFGIDIFGELERLVAEPYALATSSRIMRELGRIALGKSKDARAARLAMRLVKEKGVRVVPSAMPADEWLLAEAEKGGAIVCTNDKKLIERLKKRKIRRIQMRGKDHLDFA